MGPDKKTGHVVHAISAQEAAHRLEGLHALDPRGMLTAHDIETIGVGSVCLQVSALVDEAETGTGVMVINATNGVAWIDAAQGQGEGLTEAMHAAAVDWARQQGCTSVGCQTRRPGLVAKLEGLQWRVTGWIMKCEVPHADA